MAVVPERPISGVRSGSVDHLKQCAKQLGRLLHRLRGLGLETVDRGHELRIILRADGSSGSTNQRRTREHAQQLRDNRAVWTLIRARGHDGRQREDLSGLREPDHVVAQLSR